MLNKVILIGNLGADPEVRYMQDGTCVCNLRLATTERYKDRSGERQEKTEWHRIVLWRQLGEIAAKYLKKGSKVYIEGKIETRKWTDKDGADRYSTEIVANEMKMLDGKPGGGGGYDPVPAPRADNRPSGGNNIPRRAEPSYDDDPFGAPPQFGNMPMDDDVPF